MKSSTLIAVAAATLLAAGPSLAGPNCKDGCSKDGAHEDVYEVIDRDGEARESKRERGERGDKAKGKKDRNRNNPFKNLDLNKEQHEQAKAIMSSAREEGQALREEIKAKKEAGEEIDRESVREQMHAIRKAAIDEVYANVLNDEQRAKVDERRQKMEERRAEREGKEGERPKRNRKGKGEKKQRGGDESLDL